ncbi:TRAP transporter small permease subunit [uncultured Paracoccus sp.]|uniref:TRAP transporter small permease subunit n=1 Tax=uncultured Paracoccus sp. TaxID=189685 RepID=UPI0025FD40C6|nr:TRAP transporter small permease subunit [uncultured Paracoccus sp.]
MGGLLALSKGIDRVNGWIGRLASWLILLAVIISAGNAIIRKTFNISSNGWLELQWYLFGAAFMGAAAWTLFSNEHIRIDLLYARWSRRSQHWIDLLGHLFFLLPFAGLMVWYLYPWFLRAYYSGEVSMNSGGLVLWPARLILLVGFVLLFLQGLSEVIKKIAIMRGLIEDPVPYVSQHEAAEITAAETAREMQEAMENDPNAPDPQLPIQPEDRK